jgi:hypothetical protein
LELNNNFSNFKLGVKGGYKWDDLNGDGIWDDDEPAIADWDIYLTNSTGHTWTATTDEYGYYEFTGLHNDTYTVTEEFRDGWICTYPVGASYTIHISSKFVELNNNFSNFELVDIIVYKDVDADGNLSTIDDQSPYPEWWVHLYGAGGLSISASTDFTGSYIFQNLGPGIYSVEEDLPYGWTPLNESIFYDFGEVSSGGVYEVTFINFQWLNISGHKYFDFDRTHSELKPLAGWTIELYSVGEVDPLDTDITDENGYYEFLITNPGDYKVMEVLKDGWTFTWTRPGLDYNFISVSSGVDLENYDFWNTIFITWMSDTSDEPPARVPVTDFKIVFTPDLKEGIFYKISATNPGGFYFNIICPAASVYETLYYTLPVEFVTKGAKPIHAYIWEDSDPYNNLVDYWYELEDISKNMTVDYVNRNITLSGVDPDHLVLFTIHVTFDLKGTGGYEYGEATAFNGINYTFKAEIDHLVDWHSETNLTAHAKVKQIKDPAVYGIALDQTKEDTPVPGITFSLYNSKGRRVDYFTTDEYGFYIFNKLKVDTYILEIEIPLVILHEGDEIDLVISITMEIKLLDGDYIQVSLTIKEGSITAVESSPDSLPEEIIIDPLSADTDGDGLTDGEEIGTYGTDPLIADTDGDGLTDGDEVNTYGTDPLSADTDADGLTDGEEVSTHGTDPLLADTDADGLTDGVEVSTHGTDPLIADTDGDGLTDGVEINTHGTDPMLADTDGDGLTDGEEVSTHGTDPLLADTDGDGLTDGEEIGTYSTDPLLADTDGDGLTDSEEISTYGTDPLLADTDGDGLTDSEEISTYGTDPLLADTDGDGLTDSEEISTYDTDPLLADTDADGLADGEEVSTYGTDPLLADTDGDGLTDGEEVSTYGTDPLDPDSVIQSPNETSDPTSIPTKIPTTPTNPTPTTTFAKKSETPESTPGWTLFIILSSLVVLFFKRRTKKK